MTTSGVRGATSSPTFTSFSVTTPPTGAVTVASASAFSLSGDLRVYHGEPRACGVDLLAARASLDARRRFAEPPARAPWRPSAAAPPRHAAPARRLALSASRRSRGAATRSVRGRPAHWRAPTLPRPRRPARPRPGPPPAACPRFASPRAAGAAAHRPARDRHASAARASSVSRVSRRAMTSPWLTRSPSATLQLEDPAAHLRRHLHVVGLDVAGDADAVGRPALRGTPRPR